MTDRFVVFVEQPMTWNTLRALFHRATATPLARFWNWDPKGTTFIHLLDRQTGERHPGEFLWFLFAYMILEELSR